MASSFIQRHKKKTLASALLFFLRKGRGIIPLLLIVVLVSVPFIVPGSTLVRVPGVAGFMNAIGMGSVVSRWSQGSSAGAFSAFRAALEKAAQSGREGSFWNSVFRRMASTLPSDQSSIALVVGGKEIADRHKVSVLVSKTKLIKGVVNPDDKKARREADGVYLGDIPGLDYSQAGMGDMDVLGINTPYYSGSRRKTFPTGADTQLEFFGGVLADAGGNVPIPVGPARVRARKMGRLSGFSWRNLSFGRRKSNVNARINDKGAMFRLAETFAMTATAYKSDTSALEYQTTYVGATYDGTDANADILQTGVGAPDVPDTGFAEDLMQGVDELTDLAEECAESQANEGKRMSDAADEMDRISGTLGSPPKCCSSAVSKWNRKIDNIKAQCVIFNTNAAVLSQKCQGAGQQMNCGSYNSMKIKKCSKLKCWLSAILGVLMIIVGIALFAFGLGIIGLPLIIGGGLMIAGQLIGGIAGVILSTIGAAVGAFAGGVWAMLAAATAYGIISQTLGSGGGEDGEEG